MNPTERVEVFLRFWAKMEKYLRGYDATLAAIVNLRAQTLQEFCLTEDDIKAYEAVEQGFEGVDR